MIEYSLVKFKAFIIILYILLIIFKILFSAFIHYLKVYSFSNSDILFFDSYKFKNLILGIESKI